MKKILTPLTGIVILITILIAGACNTAGSENDSSEGTEDTKSEGSSFDLIESNVTIYLKDTLIDGRKHLLMYDSKDTKRKVVDTLTTNVQPGDDILWKTVKGSDIQHINSIRPVIENGTIFPEEARADNLMTAYHLKVPDNALPGTTEKYEIVFTDNDGRTWCIDPYLRIPPARTVGDDTIDH